MKQDQHERQKPKNLSELLNEEESPEGCLLVLGEIFPNLAKMIAEKLTASAENVYEVERRINRLKQEAESNAPKILSGKDTSGRVTDKLGEELQIENWRRRKLKEISLRRARGEISAGEAREEVAAINRLADSKLESL